MPALLACGYTPLRVDSVQHNGKIDDRIIAEIRKSGPLVADFTGHRGGVYFEAGFGLGLRHPGDFEMCRDDDIGHAHFDTRQYNHITWTTPADLEEKLRARIEATLATLPRVLAPTRVRREVAIRYWNCPRVAARLHSAWTTCTERNRD